MCYKNTRYLIIMLFLMFAVACAREEPPPVETEIPTPAATPIPRGGSLTIRLSEDVEQLRPWAPRSLGEEQIISVMYLGLTRLNERLEPEPDLATSWAIDPLGKTITMTLRTDMTWHDGQPLTSDDARWTLQLLRSLAQPTTLTDTGALTQTTPLIEDMSRIIHDIQAPAADLLILHLNEPYAPLLSELTLPILPRHLLEKYSTDQMRTLDLWSVPVGSGPFKFKSHEPGHAILLTPYAGYSLGEPYLSQVAFIVAPDPAVAAQALKDRKLLVAELPWQTSQAFSSSQTLSSTLRLGSYPENGYYFLAFNLRQGHIFADQRLRQALAYAINLTDIINTTTKGQGIPLGSDLLPGLWPGNGPAPSDYNPDKARQLLDQAGWLLPAGASIRESHGLTLTAQLLVTADDQRRVAIADKLSVAAQAVGIRLVVTPVDVQTTLFSKLAPPFDYDLLLMGWSNSRVDQRRSSYMAYDPDNFPLFHSSQIYQGTADSRPGLRNIVGFSDQSFDNQVTAARSLYDLTQRKSIYPQLASILFEKRPYLFLWTDRQVVVMDRRLKSTDGPINLNTPAYLGQIAHWYLE